LHTAVRARLEFCVAPLPNTNSSTNWWHKMHNSNTTVHLKYKNNCNTTFLSVMRSWKYFIPASCFLPPYFAALGNHLLVSGNPTYKKNYAKSHELHIVRKQVLPALHHAHLNTMDACHTFYKFHFFENYFTFIITTASTTPKGWQKSWFHDTLHLPGRCLPKFDSYLC